jgi:hypothetical protein
VYMFVSKMMWSTCMSTCVVVSSECPERERFGFFWARATGESVSMADGICVRGGCEQRSRREDGGLDLRNLLGGRRREERRENLDTRTHRDRTFSIRTNVFFWSGRGDAAGAATRRARRVPMILCKHTYWVIPNSLQLSKTITTRFLCGASYGRAVSASAQSPATASSPNSRAAVYRMASSSDNNEAASFFDGLDHTAAHPKPEPHTHSDDGDGPAFAVARLLTWLRLLAASLLGSNKEQETPVALTVQVLLSPPLTPPLALTPTLALALTPTLTLWPSLTIPTPTGRVGSILTHRGRGIGCEGGPP